MTPSRTWAERAAHWPLDLLWLGWTVVVHGVETAIVLAMVAVAGAILWLPAGLLDNALGVPVGRFAVVAVTAAAAAGAVRGLWREARQTWADCPW